MIRIFKGLGVVIAASLAMSAVGTAGASASPFFHSEFAGIVLTGQAGAKGIAMTTDAGELECETLKLSGSQGAMTTTTMTLVPKFEGCAFDNESTGVTVNGCAFTFHLEEQTEPIEARMGIECPFAGGRIEIDANECTITIPAQTPRNSVTFTNEGAEKTRSFIADVNVSGLHYVEHGAGCANETVTTENGTFTGQLTITGEDSEAHHVGIWVA